MFPENPVKLNVMEIVENVQMMMGLVVSLYMTDRLCHPAPPSNAIPISASVFTARFISVLLHILLYHDVMWSTVWQLIAAEIINKIFRPLMLI